MRVSSRFSSLKERGSAYILLKDKARCLISCANKQPLPNLIENNVENSKDGRAMHAFTFASLSLLLLWAVIKNAATS